MFAAITGASPSPEGMTMGVAAVSAKAPARGSIDAGLGRIEGGSAAAEGSAAHSQTQTRRRSRMADKSNG